jgi:hypothetical protein
MKPLRFNKLTQKIGLVLISSTLILSGCSRPGEEEKKDDRVAPGQPAGGGHAGVGHGGYVPIGRTAVVTGGGGQGGPAAPAVSSARGGFGATGHAATGGS